MARHRGKFDPTNPNPYELSRSAVETFIKCKACFWLEKKAGVKQPEMPSFTLNTNTDILLKRDADAVRGVKSLPLWEANGLGHLIPYQHEHLENWTNSLQFGLNDTYFNFDHEPSGIRFGGGLDDVFQDTRTGQLHIVDYKSTAQGTRNPNTYQRKPVSIDDSWKKSYKRQMDMYVWIMRQKGLDVSATGYFVYVDAQHVNVKGMLSGDRPEVAWMPFLASIIPYESDSGWVEETLIDIREFLEQQSDCPAHTPGKPIEGGCDYGRYLEQASKALM